MMNEIPSEAPFLAEYFGIWAMKEDLFRTAFERVRNMDLAMHIRVQKENSGVQAAAGAGDTLYHVTKLEDGIALVDIRGTLMKQQTSLDSGTSTVAVRRSIRSLANDDNVKGVMVRIESPGGTSAGTQEVAEDLAALAARKPCNIYIDDLGASAAYWIASQGNFISTNPQGWVGSIGTYACVYDYSGQAAMEGIKVNVVRAGEFKGAGVPGTEVTASQLAEWQRLVDQTNNFFLESIAKGRRMSMEKVKQLNDGRVHIGTEAKAMGLVDAVESFDQAMERLRMTVRGKSPSPAMRSETDNNPGIQQSAGVGAADPTSPAGAGNPTPVSDAEQRKEADVSQPNPAPAAPTSEPPKAATMAELKIACPGAPSDFLVAQAEKNATVAQAKDEYLQFQAAQIRSRDEELTKLKADANKQVQQPAAAPVPQTRKPGVAPIASNPAETQTREASAGEEFKAKVEAKAKGGMLRHRAVASVARENPVLHQEMLAEANAR